MGILGGSGVRGEPICDFCAGKPVTHILYARAFDVSFGPLVVNSGEEWAACDTCWDLIRRGKWSVVTLRSIEACTRVYPDMPWESPSFKREATEFARRLHMKLRENLVGRGTSGNGGTEGGEQT